MFTARGISYFIAMIVGLSLPTLSFAEPQIFSDDFQTSTTYNHQTFVDACTGALPDWTIMATFDGSSSYERAVRGGGSFYVSNWAFNNSNYPGLRMETVFVGWGGGIVGCTGEPPVGESNKKFIDDDLCIIGGFRFNGFQLASQNLSHASGPVDPLNPGPENWGLQYGADFAPGIAGVDDDGDGSIDNDPNCDFGGPTGGPGRDNIDDDTDGTVDEADEAFVSPVT